MARIGTARVNDERIESTFQALHQRADCILPQKDFVTFLEMSHNLKLRRSLLADSSTAVNDVIAETSQIAHERYLEIVYFQSEHIRDSGAVTRVPKRENENHEVLGRQNVVAASGSIAAYEIGFRRSMFKKVRRVAGVALTDEGVVG